MEKKLMETGKVANIESRAIFLQDHCKVRLGTENVIDHEVNFCPDPERPNPIIGSYGIVTLKRRQTRDRRQTPLSVAAERAEARETAAGAGEREIPWVYG